MSTDDSSRIDDQASILARYTDLSWHPLVLQTEVPAAALDAFTAAALHVAPHTLVAFRSAFAHARRSSLHQLLNDASLTEVFTRLPSMLGPCILVVGDSISADAFSWANLLKDLVTALHPHARVVNNSLTGRTTGEGIPALAHALTEAPTHVFIMLGVNDIRRYGSSTTITMTSMAEVRRNLTAMVTMAADAGAVTTLITPPPTSPSSAQLRWAQDDFCDVAKVVLDVDPGAINLRHEPVARHDYWLADGVHPSPSGPEPRLANRAQGTQRPRTGSLRSDEQ